MPTCCCRKVPEVFAVEEFYFVCERAPELTGERAVWSHPSIWFDPSRVTPKSIASKIRKRVSRGAKRKVYIKADARVTSYCQVVEVLNSVRSLSLQPVPPADYRPALPSHR